MLKGESFYRKFITFAVALFTQKLYKSTHALAELMFSFKLSRPKHFWIAVTGLSISFIFEVDLLGHTLQPSLQNKNPLPVVIAPAQSQDVPIYLHALGTVMSQLHMQTPLSLKFQFFKPNVPPFHLDVGVL